MDKAELALAFLHAMRPPDEPEHRSDEAAHRHRRWRRALSAVVIALVLASGGLGYWVRGSARAADVSPAIDAKIKPLIAAVGDLKTSISTMRTERDQERKDALEVQIVETQVRCLAAPSNEIRALLRAQVARARAQYRRLNNDLPFQELPLCPDR